MRPRKYEIEFEALKIRNLTSSIRCDISDVPVLICLVTEQLSLR